MQRVFWSRQWAPPHWLTFYRTRVSSLAGISQLQHLQQLELEKSNITDDALAEVGQLGILWRLDLSDTKVSDEGLKHVLGLKQLTTLNLSRTNIQTSGLLSVQALPSLKVIGVDLTIPSISDDDKARLTAGFQQRGIAVSDSLE